uniref:Uncharacterized protein n=1 Tax=Vitis vinifera TaxID=29760 RepID=F6H1Y1_VITVI
MGHGCCKSFTRYEVINSDFVTKKNLKPDECPNG